VAWREGLSAATEWAAEYGHLLPPATAVWNGYPVGTWAKIQRTAGRLADTIAQRREAGRGGRMGRSLASQETEQGPRRIGNRLGPCRLGKRYRLYRRTSGPLRLLQIRTSTRTSRVSSPAHGNQPPTDGCGRHLAGAAECRHALPVCGSF
ncbi:helicase associated domain-containing protein, partial [Actinacidiphila sp. bgisy160]|uniref:helicase associated domain-containing protein n=1 Tax=Actinacidiphila sp. bgisy160 TaxID=3413796 RepID=UPI003D75D75E